MSIDCHQHLWPPAFIAALRERTTPPLLDRWTLSVGGEAPFQVDPDTHDVDKRRAQELREGKDLVLLSLSSPLGIEHLPFEGARKLIYTWHESSLELGDPFSIWAATPVTSFDLDGLTDILGQDRVVGLQLPATALDSPAAIRRMKPVLDVLQSSNQPLLIHPGPAPPVEDTPSWWPAMVPYVSQLHASWLAWHAVGRERHPDLKVAFVALAGLAPLHHERLVARGGQFGAVDPHIYYETSSYDTRAIDATIRVVGVDALVHGSDRPYAQPKDPGLGHAFTHALFSANPEHLLKGTQR